MAVTWTYDAPSNTATANGTGSTTIDDLIAADTAGGWGKFTTDATGVQILCQAKIAIGDGINATACTASLKQITFAPGVLTANSQAFITVNDNSSLTLGILADAATKRTRDGCTIFTNEPTYYGHLIRPNSNAAAVYLYGCSFFAKTMEAWWQALKAYNINCNGKSYPHISIYTSAAAQDYNNIIISGEGTNGSGYGVRRPNTATSLNNLFILVPNQKIWFQAGPGTCKNVYFRGVGLIFRFESVVGDCYIVNADDGGVAWTADWAGTDYQGKVYRQYEFDLQVIDNQANGAPVQNARVRVFDKNGVELTKTGSGYTSAPTVSIDAPPEGGTQATATAIVSINGRVIGFTITNGGSGYTSVPAVTITGGGGAGATAIATVVDGVVTAITPTLYTDVNGDIPTTTLDRGYYTKATGNTQQDNAPLKLKITKEGYMDYNDEMTPKMKTQYQVSMNRTLPVIITPEGKMLIDMYPTNPQSLFYAEM